MILAVMHQVRNTFLGDIVGYQSWTKMLLQINVMLRFGFF